VIRWALVKAAETTTVRLAGAARPEPQPDELLVRVRAAANRGTDLPSRAADSLGSVRRDSTAGRHGTRVLRRGRRARPGCDGCATERLYCGETHVPSGQSFQGRNGRQHICGNPKLFGVHRDGYVARGLRLMRVRFPAPALFPHHVEARQPLGLTPPTPRQRGQPFRPNRKNTLRLAPAPLRPPSWPATQGSSSC
jgi:threonine dehydrogenase-like Zn-dependent dehydrogenase